MQFEGLCCKWGLLTYSFCDAQLNECKLSDWVRHLNLMPEWSCWNLLDALSEYFDWQVLVKSLVWDLHSRYGSYSCFEVVLSDLWAAFATLWSIATKQGRFKVSLERSYIAGDLVSQASFSLMHWEPELFSDLWILPGILLSTDMTVELLGFGCALCLLELDAPLFAFEMCFA